MDLFKRKKYILFSILLFLISACSIFQKDSTSANNTDNNRIRVLSYNIKHGETPSGVINLKLIANTIKEQNPDIVALQEVDKNNRRTGNVDQTAKLAELTGLHGYFGTFRDYKGGQYGDAILSKYPVDDFKVVPADSSIIHRGMSYIFAKLKTGGESPVYFNCSHLAPHAKYSEQRVIQTQEIIDYWKQELDSNALIVAGDLNSKAGSKPIQMFSQYFNLSDTTFSPTFSAQNPNRKLDYILYPKSKKNWEVVEFKRICKENSADHCAILSVLQLNNN